MTSISKKICRKLLVKSWSNSKRKILNCAKEEQKAPYLVVNSTKYGAFTNCLENHVATRGHSHSIVPMVYGFVFSPLT